MTTKGPPLENADTDSAPVSAPAATQTADDGGGARSTPPAGLRHRGPAAAVAVAMAALAFSSYPSVAQGAIAAFIAGVVVLLAAVDVERRIIPNQIVLPATAIVFVARAAESPDRVPEFLLVALGAGLAFLIPNLISRSLIGMGDVKFAIFLGAGMGLAAVGAIVVAFFSIFPVAALMVIRDGAAARKSTIPFGPFLALGALVILIVPRLIGLGTA